MPAIFYAIVSYLGWGAGDVFGAVATRRIGAYSTSFWVAVIGVLVFSFYTPFALMELVNYNPPLLMLNILLAFLYVAVNVLINLAFQISNVSLIGTIFSSFAAFTSLFSLIFMGERVSLPQGLAMMVVFLGVFISTLDIKELKKGRLIEDKGVRIALTAMIFAALYFTFIKIPVAKVGWFWPNYLPILLFPLVFFYMKARKIKLEKPNLEGALAPLIICTIMLRSGDFAFNLGISKGLTSIVAPIAGAYPTLFAALSFFVFREPLKKQQLAGIVTTLAGIVFLSAVSV